MERQERGIVSILEHRLQPPLLQVPHGDDAPAPARRQQWNPRPRLERERRHRDPGRGSTVPKARHADGRVAQACQLV